VDAADDGRARVQSHRDTQRTDYFCKHRGKVVRRPELATSKQASRRSYAIRRSPVALLEFGFPNNLTVSVRKFRRASRLQMHRDGLRKPIR